MYVLKIYEKKAKMAVLFMRTRVMTMIILIMASMQVRMLKIMLDMMTIPFRMRLMVIPMHIGI